MLRKLKSKTKNWVLNNGERLLGNKNLKRLTMCKKCYTFYYKNSWHFYKPYNVEIDQNVEIPVRFTECTACLEQEASLYEMGDFILGKG